MRIVIRLGGSVIASPADTKLIDEYVRTLKTLRDMKNDIAVVVGGGNLAREFIGISKELGLKMPEQDDMAIWVSRLYAQLFAKALGKSVCGPVSFTLEEAAQSLENGKIAVMGGLKPGMTTDTVAALLAARVNAKLIIKATDQEGVYDKDPRKHAEAMKLDHLKLSDLTRVLEQTKHIAGIHQIIDPEAAKTLKHIHARTVIVNGFRPDNLIRAAEGKPIGTLID